MLPYDRCCNKLGCSIATCWSWWSVFYKIKPTFVQINVIHVWYMNSTSIFWADLDIYPLILKDRKSTMFRTVQSSLATDPSNIFLPGPVLNVILRNTEYFQWTTPSLSPRITCQKSCLKNICVLDLIKTEDKTMLLQMPTLPFSQGCAGLVTNHSLSHPADASASPHGSGTYGPSTWHTQGNQSRLTLGDCWKQITISID